MSAKKNEIKPAEKKAVSKKANKNEKKFPVKKLPALFRKKLDEKKFDKKILSKIYIPQDKDYISSLYKKTTENEKVFYAIPADSQFTKTDLSRLKVLAKEIKGQKGRIKFLPLIATVSFIVALAVVVSIFKNPIAKKIIKGTCESIFTAKTDIKSVNVKFLDSFIKVNSIQIGNKNSEYKNLFEAETIVLDFNLTQLLRGHFVAENLEVSEMKFNTDRTTSCRLPLKEKAEKKESKESPFMKNCKDKILEETNSCKEKLQALFGDLDIASLSEKIMTELKTPALCEELKTDVQQTIGKWSSKPKEIESQIATFAKDVATLQNLNVNSIKDLSELNKNLTLIKNTISTGQKLSGNIKSITDDFDKDVKKVSSYSKQVEQSVKDDKAYVQNSVNGIKDTVLGAKQIFTSAIQSLGYSVLGKYYPYAEKLISYGVKLKNESNTGDKTKLAKTEKKEKKAKIKKVKKERLSGTTFWYGTDYPSFYIQRAFASGPAFKCELKELSSNHNLTKKASTVAADFITAEISHKINGVFDIRTDSAAKMIHLDYTGSGFNFDVKDSENSEGNGIPCALGKADLKLSGDFDENYFRAYGNASLNPLTLSSNGFNNEKIDSYYKKALAQVTDLKLGYEVLFSDSNLSMDLNGNFAEKFVNALKGFASSAGGDAAKDIMAKVNEKLGASSNEYLSSISDFNSIQSQLDVQRNNLDKAMSDLNKKQAELEAKIKNYASSAAKDAAKETTKNAAGNLLNGLKKF